MCACRRILAWIIIGSTVLWLTAYSERVCMFFPALILQWFTCLDASWLPATASASWPGLSLELKKEAASRCHASVFKNLAWQNTLILNLHLIDVRASGLGPGLAPPAPFVLIRTIYTFQWKCGFNVACVRLQSGTVCLVNTVIVIGYKQIAVLLKKKKVSYVQPRLFLDK